MDVLIQFALPRTKPIQFCFNPAAPQISLNLLHCYLYDSGSWPFLALKGSWKATASLPVCIVEKTEPDGPMG